MTWRNEYYGNAQRVRRWTAKLQDAFSTGSWNQQRVASGYLGSLVIELDNLIVDSLRSYALALVRRHQALGNPIRRIGIRTIADNEFNAFLLEQMKPAQYQNRGRPISINRRDAPNVRDPAAMLHALNGSHIVGLGDLGNAVALNFSVFSDIKFPRHYYAHRNFSTFDTLRRNAPPLASGLVKTPEDYLCFINPATRAVKFTEWTDEVRTFFDIATP